MKKSMVAVCLAAVCVTVSAEENPILTAARQISAECDVKQASMCWQPAAERVSRLPEPRSKREWEQRVFDYHMLARLAQRVGDLRDARNFYDRMLSATSGVRDGEEARLLAYSDIAELELSMREYQAALDHLEPAG